MNCEENKLKISLLIDGELEDAEASVLQRHIGECAECAAYFRNLRSALKVLEHAPRISASASFHKRLESRLRRSGSGAYVLPVRTRMWARKIVAAVVAAGVLIAIVLILSSLGVENGDTKPPPGGTDKIADNVEEKDVIPPAPVPVKDIVKPGPQEEKKEPVGLPREEKFVNKPETPAPGEKHVPPEQEQEETEDMVHDPLKEPDTEGPPKKPETPKESPETKLADGSSKGKPVKDDQQEVKQADKSLKELEKKLTLALKAGDIDLQVDIIRNVPELLPDRACKLLKNLLAAKKVDTAVRREAIFALADVGTKQAAEVILFYYADPDWQVSDTVPQALSKIKKSETLEWLAGEVMVSSKSATMRKMLAEALAQTKEPVSQKLFAAALEKEKDATVRAAICEALGAVGDTSVEETLIRSLSDKSWLVRESALRSLARTGTMKCVTQLIRSLNDPKPLVKEAAAIALAQNPDVRAVVPLVRLLMYKDIRLHGAVLTALWRITGKQYKTEEKWHAWLKEVGQYPETNPNPDAVPPAPAMFLDIPLWSKSVIFLVDVSTSMHGAGKIEEAKQLIQKSIIELPEDTKFNVVFFGSSLRCFSQTKMPKADKHTKEKALGWLEKVRLSESGRTNFYNALVSALRNEPDDVIVVSDGVPSEGRFVHPSKVVREITNQNLWQKTRIHCVGFYTLQPTEGRTPVPVGPSVDFMKSLAARNRGEFKYRWFTADNNGK